MNNKNPRSHRSDLADIAHRVMLSRGFRPDFTAAERSAVAGLRDAVPAQTQADGGEVRDLRRLLWASIDNDDSQDLDQLSVCEPLADGVVKILVAIADVDVLVPQSSPLDGHAQHNTTSVYTAAAIFPMLPERLSTDLTSLADRQDRLAMVIEMCVTPDGRVSDSAIYRALVHNHAKLAYNSVAAWLDGEAEAPAPLRAVAGMDKQIRIQERVAQALKTRRHQHGALVLETVEPRAVFVEGVVSDMRIERKNRAKELIEDFMIAANGVTARFLNDQGFPSLRRVLRSPERWERIVKLAAGLGSDLPAAPNSGALEAFLQEQKRQKPERFADLSLSVVKLMGAGEYALTRQGETPPGHFGLAVRDYAHSTAPNRRFPDLVTQRLLKAALAGQRPPYSDAELNGLAQHCTEMENNANKVERQVRKSAAAFLLADRIGERFAAIVTGVTEKGTWVRLCHPSVEGMLVRNNQGVDVGDRIEVELLSTDIERGYIDFAAVR